MFMKLYKKFYFVAFYDTSQTAQAVRHSLPVREVWGSNLEPISHTLPMIRHCCNLRNVGPGKKRRRWVPFTRDTQKNIKWV